MAHYIGPCGPVVDRYSTVLVLPVLGGDAVEVPIHNIEFSHLAISTLSNWEGWSIRMTKQEQVFIAGPIEIMFSLAPTPSGGWSGVHFWNQSPRFSSAAYHTQRKMIDHGLNHWYSPRDYKAD